jgi:ligand-binding SRPBCC domain-containing protein
MPTFDYRGELSIAGASHDVFSFFADAANLEKITPPWLNFHMLTPQPVQMRVGATIDYRLRVRGLPLRWRTLITCWEPSTRFVDEQVRGPYRIWIHEHTFEQQGQKTLARDHVRYAPPGGRIIDRLFVRRDIERIFAYRAEALRRYFPGT